MKSIIYLFLLTGAAVAATSVLRDKNGNLVVLPGGAGRVTITTGAVSNLVLDESGNTLVDESGNHATDL